MLKCVRCSILDCASHDDDVYRLTTEVQKLLEAAKHGTRDHLLVGPRLAAPAVKPSRAASLLLRSPGNL